uniref:Prolyl 4-hydroxylase alpha-subunit N-terminal domain-containing protein n=1 Tax=Cuerna arida TaxID=1464854 RepID=A0A1B6FXC8_9HEMI
MCTSSLTMSFMLLIAFIILFGIFQITESVQRSLTSAELQDHHKRVEKTISMVIDYYLELYGVYRAYKKNPNQEITLIEKLQEKEPVVNKALQEDNTHCEEKQMKILNMTLTCIEEMWMFVMKKAGIHQTVY